MPITASIKELSIEAKSESNMDYSCLVVCFLDGMKDSHDGINLGIHEIAMHFKLENQIYYNGESEFFNPEAVEWHINMGFFSWNGLKSHWKNGLALKRSCQCLMSMKFFARGIGEFSSRDQISFFEYHPALL